MDMSDLIYLILKEHWTLVYAVNIWIVGIGINNHNNILI